MKYNNFLADMFFVNVMIQCVLAISNYQHLSAALGFFCALMMCGVIESQGKLIAAYDKFITEVAA